MKQLRYKAIFDTNIEKINPLFSKVKIRIAYTGENRNGSYISKDAFEKALPTIYNCPIIGEFIESVDDFGSHGGKIEISDDGIKYVHTTKPYGVINESSEISWEDFIEEDGTVNTYLCATGYLWTGRYEELESVITNSKNQSMEIQIKDGAMQKVNGKDVFVIDDFVFSAFCILGDSVEPCFESSQIAAYHLNKDEFKAEFTRMLEELKEFQSSISGVDNTNTQEGGKDLVNEKLELIAKYGLTIEQLDFSIEELTFEELEAKLKESDNTSDAKEEESKQEEIFSATYRQKQQALNDALDPVIKRDDEGRVIYEEFFWVQDFDDKYVYVEKSVWTVDDYNCSNGRFTYSFDEENLTATITGEFEEMVVVWLTIEEHQKLQQEREEAISKLNALKAEFDEYKNNHSTPNDEVAGLIEFKNMTLQQQRKDAEDALFEQFSELNGMAEFEELKQNASNYEIDILEEKCYAILGKKNAKFSFSKQPKNNNKVKLPLTKTSQEREEEYEDLFKKYLKGGN